MKKLILATALLTISMMGFSAPTNGEAGQVVEKNISTAIKSQIQFPGFLIDREGVHMAVIFFKISDSGGMQVEDVKCDDDELRANLLSQVKNIKISTTGMDIRDVYKVVVKFEIL